MDNVLKALAQEIDAAAKDGDTFALNALIDKCEGRLESEIGKNRAIYHFFQANCYTSLSIINQVSEPDFEWSWLQDARVSEVLCLRKAILEQDFSELDPIFQCKIFTNLGSSLDFLGRFVEAIKYWDAALEVLPNFAMALGNKGHSLFSYGQSLYDYSHTGILTDYARKDLKTAISEGALWDSGSHPEAEEHFKKYYDSSVEHLKNIDYDFEFDLDQWSLGESEKEFNYRGWCLHHRLFLSPLNDVCRLTAAAQDVIHLPSHTYNIGEQPRFPNYFNLLKQEYVTARFMFFEALNDKNEHIADKDVLLIGGLDGAQFGYRSEQLKTSYRLAYSLFDKIALFLNDYFSVGLKAGSVFFRKIWWTKKNELHSCFEDSKNWPLRGLYYLSKDLFDEGFIDVSLPDAQELASLRNRTEHRFLSLQSYASSIENTETHSYITMDEFEDKALRVLTMAREALIYLSLAMHREETIRDLDRNRESEA